MTTLDNALAEINNAVGSSLQFAVTAHGGQRYGNDTFDNELCFTHPFSAHLHMALLAAFMFGVRKPAVLRAICGHDLLEDTTITPSDLYEAGFTIYEIALIYSCTDGDGATRAERKLEAYRRIQCLEDAVLVKLADRIANVWHTLTTGSLHYFKYKDEHREFFHSCFKASQADALPLWMFLESLFRTETCVQFWQIHSCSQRSWAVDRLSEIRVDVPENMQVAEIIEIMNVNQIKVGPLI